MTPVTVSRGDSPIILGLPHTGTFVPDAVKGQLNARGRELADTDWHIDPHYTGLIPGLTTVRANFHRYVIDVNRILKAGACIPAKTRLVWCRSRISTTRTSGTANLPMQKSSSADLVSTPPIMRHWLPRSSGCAKSTA